MGLSPWCLILLVICNGFLQNFVIRIYSVWRGKLNYGGWFFYLKNTILRHIGKKSPLLVLLFPSFESVNRHQAFIGILSVSMGALAIHSFFWCILICSIPKHYSANTTGVVLFSSGSFQFRLVSFNSVTESHSSTPLK